MTSTQHGAFNLQIPSTIGVPTEQSSLVSIIHGQSVAVSKSKVSGLVEDGSVTTSTSLVIYSDPVGAVIAISNDALICIKFQSFIFI